MNSLLALAGTTSFLNMPGNSSSAYSQFEDRIPGFGMLQGFLKTWLKLDLTTVVTIAALIGAASGGIQSLRATGSKLSWWVVKFFTATISITGSDRLNREVINWLGAQVLTKHGTRILTAHSETIQSDAHYWYRSRRTERHDYHDEKRAPVQYLPTFGTTWFIYERNIFMVSRIFSQRNQYYGASATGTPEEFCGAPEGDEPLVVMCLGRSVAPIKRFLEHCRDFSEKQREAYVTVRASKASAYDPSWDTTILRPIRPLETVHFDEKLKQELVDDITNYLDSNTRKYYNRRGIPYRRGYLLHGPPGTGKTSLSLALAGRFGLELYLVHVPTIKEDTMLDKLFTSLPPRCIVLLEDIDAVGIKRRSDLDNDDDESSDSEDDDRVAPRSRCTLSGLLNILDGVSSQEGRIVLMTSNFAEKLDKALVRPGRVDKQIYLGNISKRSAELMFLRMYAADTDGPVAADKTMLLSNDELKKMALEFSSHIPDDVFSPAQLQGCLLSYRDSPVRAVAGIEGWVKEEQLMMAETKEKAKKAAENRKKKRRAKKLKSLAKLSKDLPSDDSDADSDEELEALVEKMKKEREEKKQKKAEIKKSKRGKTDGTDDAVLTNGVSDEKVLLDSEKEDNTPIDGPVANGVEASAQKDGISGENKDGPVLHGINGKASTSEKAAIQVNGGKAEDPNTGEEKNGED
ncbi:BCS1 N terminal-domain-containing protein [Apodospora peruviana]|uniref:BCS1 N terminal-domain-containing protein n=1 Tax=Apodospora peruviana TaxID=516989 RepID=A0AAE0HVI0_9PEZI|nr:BCS1 N terminal-domain-containing protein [Apodospora peruviana]